MRHGAEEKLPGGNNVGAVVYKEMLLQISRDYAGLPDARQLKISEIRFFYDGLRAELIKHTQSD